VDVSTVVDITKDNMNKVDSEDSAAHGQLEAAALARRGDSFYFDALL
jgi:hypothetical protein